MMRRLWKLADEMRLLRAWDGIRVSWGGLCSPGLMKGMSQIREPVVGPSPCPRGVDRPKTGEVPVVQCSYPSTASR